MRRSNLRFGILFSILYAAMLLGTVAIARAASSAPTMALPDCAGGPTVRPESVTLACADAGITAEKLQWTGWGSTFAAAVGVASVNTCTPNCAAGTYKHYRIVLIATGQQHCSNGQTAYAKVSYAFIGAAPSSVDPDPTVPYKCK
jgi:hypothetical protein